MGAADPDLTDRALIPTLFYIYQMLGPWMDSDVGVPQYGIPQHPAAISCSSGTLGLTDECCQPDSASAI